MIDTPALQTLLPIIVLLLLGPDLEAQVLLSPLIRSGFPNLKRYAVITDSSQQDHFRALSLNVVVEQGDPPGVDVATAVLRELGKDELAISEWARRQRTRGHAAAPLPHASRASIVRDVSPSSASGDRHE